MQKVLSIDYGLKHIGLAISDTQAQIAKVLEPLISSKRRVRQKKLLETVEQLQVSTVLLGTPMNITDGDLNDVQAEIAELETLLRNHNLQVVTWEESYTSKLAAEKYQGKKDKQLIHSEAARIMLQEYLDYINSGI